MSIEAAKADLANLEEQAKALETKLADMRTEIERIKNYIELAPRYSGDNETYAVAQIQVQLNHVSNPAPRKEVPLEDEPLIQACRGKSIADAAIALIRLAGRPLSEEEIVEQLRRAGVTLVSENPTVNLRFALLRKRRDTGAVKLADDKKHWDLGDDATPEDEARKKSGFIQNRDRNNHAERSRRGLLAAKERGAKNGRRSSITPEIKEVAESLIAEGAPFGEIAKLIGISAPTFTRWRKLGLVNANRPTNPEATSRRLRLVSSKS